MPSLAPFSGQVAIEQGRARPKGKAVQHLADGIARLPLADDPSDDEGGPASSSSRDSQDEEAAPKQPHPRLTPKHTQTPPSILSNKTNGKPPALAISSADNPFANISAGFNEFRGKATAAVGEAFGQTFGVTFPANEPKQPHARPAWHPQRRRSSNTSQLVDDDQDDQDHDNDQRANADDDDDTSGPPPAIRSTSAARDHPNFRSAPNLNNSSRGSLSAFASNVTLPDASLASVEAVLAQYDSEARRRLLRSNYCRNQTQFLLELQDISARLLQLPKPARLSALRAELTALNHKLPSEVCFPLWCSANNTESTHSKGSDSQNAIENKHSVPGSDGDSSLAPRPSSKKKRQSPMEYKHHRVVRINPSEAVVLNSADRAPYLLHVEILTDDLDFDPERRSNRESLKRLVVQEDVRRRKFQLTRSFGTDSEVSSKGELSRRDGPDSPRFPSTTRAASLTTVPQVAVASDEQDPGPSSIAAIPRQRPLSTGDPADLVLASSPRSSSPMALPGDDEEIDLTEQAYGSDLAAFGEERVEESDEEDHLAAVNRNHDAAAWTEARKGAALTTPSRNRHSRQGSLANGPASASVAPKRKDFSLDEYSERMRTAAIMLAQLNQSTNAGAQPVVTHNPHVSATAQGGWSSWIIGTSWASSAPNAKNEVGQGTAGVKAPVSTSGVAGTAAASARQSIDQKTTLAGAQPISSNSTSASASASGSGATPGGSSRLIHADTEAIRKRIMHEMMLLEEERMERMKSGSRRIGQRRPTAGVEDEATVLKAVNKDDPSAAMFKETWAAKKARIRAGSPYGHLPSWDVFSVIVKTGADLRQEQLAVQLINEFGRIWAECGSKLWVRYFRILVTSENSGLMETVTDAVSVHSIKKEAYARAQKENAAQQNGGKIATYSIFDHFVNTYGEPSSAKFNRARDRFMESLAAYSIISYLLQIKDRHNGNILLSSDGRIIHIDFGFMLGISPGGVGFEAAPFKLTQEYIDILGGVGSTKFEEFKELMRKGFKDVRKHAERIIMIVELMQRDSKLPCFALGEFTASNLRDRFALALSALQIDEFVDRLVLASCASSYTRLYDSFQ